MLGEWGRGNLSDAVGLEPPYYYLGRLQKILAVERKQPLNSFLEKIKC
jgi:hypothetical protein